MYVRGKPWTIVVDDIFLHYKLSGLKSALVGDDKSLWGPILEKAFAKVKGNYAAADLGLLKNGIRSLTGAPVFGFKLSSRSTYSSNDATFKSIVAAHSKNYLVNVQTNGFDSNKNKYGIPNGHAYSILDAFEMGSNQIYMIRNPWSNSDYKGKWKANDWTDEMVKYVPGGVDPRTSERDGVFFVDSNDFPKVFQYYVIGHYRPDYIISWYDQENDSGPEQTYYFELQSSGHDLYIDVESYYLKSLPESCVTLKGKRTYPVVSLEVYFNGYELESTNYYE